MTKFLNLPKLATAFLFAFSCGVFTPGFGQTPLNINPTITPEVNTGAPGDSVNIVDNSLDSPMDSLAGMQEIASAITPLYPVFPDSIYDIRIRSISSPITLTYNDQVRAIIDLYTLRKRGQVERMVGLSKIYFPVFEQIMLENQMPTDLKYLAIIESALNPHAVSRCGATGMWQFMYSTAKLYGLKINGYVDERKDIILSTQAAAAYLKNMYAVYGDWLLSIAAYNCGPGNVNKAINLSGGSYDFWTISRYLPRETRGYVPAFIAAMYVMNYYDTHNISPQYPAYDICEIATVDIFDKISFEQISKFTNTPMEEIKFLNPALRGEVIPVLTSDPYSLKLPADRMPMFDAMKDSIIFLSRGYVPKYTNSYKGYAGSGKSHIHVVRKGETLGLIASRNRCTVAQLKSWNSLRGNTIHVGQKIRVYGKGESMAKSSGTTKKSTTPNASTASSSNSKVVYYKVRSGDTLWGISNKYPGVSVADIKASNSSAKVNNLKPGMVLKINL